ARRWAHSTTACAQPTESAGALTTVVVPVSPEGPGDGWRTVTWLRQPVGEQCRRALPDGVDLGLGQKFGEVIETVQGCGDHRPFGFVERFAGPAPHQGAELRLGVEADAVVAAEQVGPVEEQMTGL